jgi:hypothetical protein
MELNRPNNIRGKGIGFLCVKCPLINWTASVEMRGKCLTMACQRGNIYTLLHKPRSNHHTRNIYERYDRNRPFILPTAKNKFQIEFLERGASSSRSTNAIQPQSTLRTNRSTQTTAIRDYCPNAYKD